MAKNNVIWIEAEEGSLKYDKETGRYAVPILQIKDSIAEDFYNEGESLAGEKLVKSIIDSMIINQDDAALIPLAIQILKYHKGSSEGIYKSAFDVALAALKEIKYY